MQSIIEKGELNNKLIKSFYKEQQNKNNKNESMNKKRRRD